MRKVGIIGRNTPLLKKVINYNVLKAISAKD